MFLNIVPMNKSVRIIVFIRRIYEDIEKIISIYIAFM